MKVGDRVRVLEHQYHCNQLGTVRSVVIQQQSIGVELDDHPAYGHSLNGKCKPGHGWYFAPSELTLCSPEPTNEFERSLFGYIDQELAR